MDFTFYPVRFQFTARQPVEFPRDTASNVLRGGFGLSLLAVAPQGHAELFAPTQQSGPSGLHDAPRPFVFRARHLDGRRYEPGEEFHFGVNLFTMRPEAFGWLRAAFAHLGESGLGRGRGRATLLEPAPPAPCVMSLQPGDEPISGLTVEFLTPTELKAGGRLAAQPDFGVLFRRVRDRVSALRMLYGAGDISADFAAMGRRADAVAMTHCGVVPVEAARRSTRTGQTHSLGGFTGMAAYAGHLGEFAPWLRVAEHTGVGRQTVWGKGELRVR